MTQRRQIHALTPGDHFSPRTGSAIPTVVHGLALHARPRPAVLVARGTYEERYDSADVIEYDLSRTLHGALLLARAAEVAAGRLGLPRPRARAVYRQLLVAQDEWDPSYVLCHNAPQMVPLVGQRHLPVLYAHNNLLETYAHGETGRVLGRCYRIVCVSQYTAARAAARLPHHLRDVIRVVPNGVDAPDGELPGREKAEQLRVVFLGRVIHEKGPHVVVDAVTRLARKDVTLTVVGSAGFSATDPLTAYERRLRVSAKQQVSFVPFQPRPSVPKILRDADVVVIPSLIPEAFGLVALEAMAAGTVVVASDIGGLPEAVADAGPLFPPGDAIRLAEILEVLATSAETLEDYRRRGWALAQSMDWSVISRRLEEALA